MAKQGTPAGERPPSPDETDHLSIEDPSEDTDGRGLWAPDSNYAPAYQRQQTAECCYLALLLAVSLTLLSLIGLGFLERALVYIGARPQALSTAERFAQLGSAGLLGGTVYGAKWLYHSVAKGLWHEDRRIWRFFAPWISVGTTVGIWALIDSGLFPVATNNGPNALQATTVVGLGFMIGYFSDMFLAKMKELTRVLFGQSEQHHRSSDREPPKP